MLKKIVLYLLAALAGIGSAFALSAVFTVTAVMGSGMEGTADNGSHVLINRLAYGADGEEKPQVGDVVAFRSDVFGEEGEGSILVRRVAGSFGDVVEIKDNIFYLNGKPYEEHMYEAAAMEPLKKTRLGQYEIRAERQQKIRHGQQERSCGDHRQQRMHRKSMLSVRKGDN